MIIFVFIAAVVLLGIYEYFSVRRAIVPLQLRAETDMQLTEPGEVLTLRYTVQNTSWLPQLNIGFSFYLDGNAEVREDEEWQARHVSSDITGTQVYRHIFLLPHRSYTGKVRISFRSRGVYTPGRFYLEVGDFLGLKSVVKSFGMSSRVVCTSKKAEDIHVENTLGGLLGEISVRRFIHEDPTLQIGYRDYTGHEPMKQISWMKTANLNRLIVRTQDHTTDADIAIVFNMGSGNAEQLEKCYEMLRTVSEELEDRGLPYAVYTNGDLRALPSGLGRPHLFMLLRRIGLSKGASYYGLGSLVSDVLKERNSDRSYILITAREDEDSLEAVRRITPYSESAVLVLTAGKEAA